MHPARLIDSLARAFRWHRRWFAAILAAVAVFATLTALSPASAGTVPVVVAARELPGGSTLGAADLEVLDYPVDVAPDGAVAEPSGLVGAEVVVTVPARRPLTRSDVLESDSLVPAGKVAVPVRFSDAETIAILSVGSRVDILGQPRPDTALTTVAAGVRVVAIPGAGQSGVLGGSGGRLVLVEATPAQSAAILSATAAGTLGYVLR